MNEQGISDKFSSSREYCFLMANETVVQQPLRLENFTSTITRFAVDFITEKSAGDKPWFFFMSYFHVHTPLFTNRSNAGRGGDGGEFAANIAELDDSVGEIVTALERAGVENDTMIFITSDNGPYQEEGWDRSGRTNVYGEDQRRGSEHRGRLKGGKGQTWEGGLRMPGAVIYSRLIPAAVAGSSISTMVTSLDVFSTSVAIAGAESALPSGC